MACNDSRCELTLSSVVSAGMLNQWTDLGWWSSLQGNLSAFVEKKPEAKAYYDLQESAIKFILPEPGFLEGIKSKDRAILKMHKVGFR